MTIKHQKENLYFRLTKIVEEEVATINKRMNTINSSQLMSKIGILN